MNAQDNNSTLDFFSEIHIYLQKIATLDGILIDIDEIDTNETSDLIETLIKKTLPDPKKEYILELKTLIEEISELENKGINHYEKVIFTTTDTGSNTPISKEASEKYVSKFYKKTQVELGSLKSNLNELIDRLEKRIQPESEKLTLGGNEQPNDQNGSNSKLDRYQTPLLFSYMRNVGIIPAEISDVKLAESLSKLTKHSAKTMKQYGFSALEDVKKDINRDRSKKKIEKYSNLNTVREYLIKIVDLIDDDIKRLVKSSKEKL